MAKSGSQELKEIMKLIDKEFSEFNDYCVKNNVRMEQLKHLTDQLFDYEETSTRRKKLALKLTLVLMFISSVYLLFTFTAVQRIVAIYSRYASIKILPYWDWTNLYYQECLVNNPYFEKNKLIIEDCEVCESLEGIDHVNNTSPAEILEDYLKSDVPVIVTDAMEEWSAMIETISFRNISKIFYEHSNVDDLIPCNFLTNLRTHGYDLFQTVLRKITYDETKSWFAHWENCDKRASKALRHLYDRPYFLPAIIDISEPNWVFGSSNYRSKNFKEINLFGDIMWFAQIRGHNHIRLVPKEPCKTMCFELEETLLEGEIVLFTDLVWQFEYLPGEDDENVAFAVAGFWEA